MPPLPSPPVPLWTGLGDGWEGDDRPPQPPRMPELVNRPEGLRGFRIMVPIFCSSARDHLRMNPSLLTTRALLVAASSGDEAGQYFPASGLRASGRL